MSSIYTIAYASSSTHLMTQNDLEKLLTQARNNNTANGVTGILLYHDGNFMQIIEGPEDTVTNMFTCIERDSRHKGIIRLLSRYYPERSFSDWSMGYVRCTEKKFEKNVPGFNVILEQEHMTVLDNDQLADSIKELLISFHKVVYKTNMKVGDPSMFIS